MGFEEEDDDYEEEGDGANRLFGFMFGNVDDSGDLDADYLEEDAKEHLAAVADKLGTSFRDIHSSCSDAAEEDDYDEKAEDAVDYQDIDEQYEGPEETTEEDYLLPRKEFFTTITAFGNNTGPVYDDENYDEDDDGDDDLEDEDDGEDDLESTAFADELESEMLALGKTGSVSDDENYDEDDDHGLEDKDEVAEDRTEVQPAHSSGEKIDKDALESDEFADELESEMLAAALDTSESEEAAFNEPLPILCVEDGAEILRFSELFALTSKKVGNKWKYPLPKERLKPANVEVNVEEDEEAFLRESSNNIFDVREEQDYTLTSTDYYSSASNQGSDCFQCSEPLGENLPPLDFNIPELSHLDQLNWEDDIVWDKSPAHDAESLEPLGSCLPEKAFHPQLLRLESRFIQDNPDNDAMRHFNKMLVPNRDLMEGSWMDNTVWETDKPVTKPKLILDLQDERMLFEISDAEEKYKHLMTHARAMIVTRPNAGVSVRGPSEGRFNISNDEHVSKPKSSQHLKLNVKKRTALKKVQTMKAKSKSCKDVVNFLKKQKKIDKEQDGLMNKKVKIKSIDGVKIEEEKKTSREGFVCGACGQPNHMRTNKHCPNKSGGKPKSLTKKKLTLKDKFTPEGKILKIKFKCGTAEKLTPARPATSDADTENKDVKVNRMKIVFSNKIKSEVVESSEEHQNQNQNQKQETDQNQPRKKIKIKIRQLKEITNVNQEGSEEQAASKRKREEEQRARDLQEQEILVGIRKFEEELNMDAEEEEEERLRAKKRRKTLLLDRNC